MRNIAHIRCTGAQVFVLHAVKHGCELFSRVGSGSLGGKTARNALESGGYKVLVVKQHTVYLKNSRGFFAGRSRRALGKLRYMIACGASCLLKACTFRLGRERALARGSVARGAVPRRAEAEPAVSYAASRADAVKHCLAAAARSCRALFIRSRIHHRTMSPFLFS